MRPERCLAAIPTPFTAADAVDYDALCAHAVWLVDNGVTGIVVNGTTGESATLTDDEKIDAMNAVWDAVSDRASVIGGVGNNCTWESLEFIEQANARARVHAFMSVVPYYNKPNQRGIVAHFAAVCDASERPVILYNVPGRTVVSMEFSAIVDACGHENVIAIKEASADLHLAAKLQAALPERVALLSGDDATAMPFMALGGDGVISVVANVAPREMSGMVDAAAHGDLPTARALNAKVAELHDLMFVYPSPMPAKAVLSQLGFGRETARLPLGALTESELAEVRSRATELGVTR